MTASELSRRRLKTYTSDPALPSDDIAMEASRLEDETGGTILNEHDAPAEEDTLEYEKSDDDGDASPHGNECPDQDAESADEDSDGKECPAEDDGPCDEELCVSDSGGPSEASDGEKDDDVTDGEGVDA